MHVMLAVKMLAVKIKIEQRGEVLYFGKTVEATYINTVPDVPNPKSLTVEM